MNNMKRWNFLPFWREMAKWRKSLWYLASSSTEPCWSPPCKSHNLGWACKSQQAIKFLWKIVLLSSMTTGGVEDNAEFGCFCPWNVSPFGVNSYSLFATAIKSASPTPEDGTHPLLSDIKIKLTHDPKFCPFSSKKLLCLLKGSFYNPLWCYSPFTHLPVVLFQIFSVGWAKEREL